MLIGISLQDVIITVKSRYVLGVDVGGGVGKGETTFEGFDATNKNLHHYTLTVPYDVTTIAFDYSVAVPGSPDGRSLSL